MADTRQPAELLLHPAVLGALLVMVVNDHWLKERFGNAATGKLSDVAGVFALPLVLVSLLELARWLSRATDWAFRRRELAAAVAATGLGFAAMKVIAPVGGVYIWTLGAVRWLGEALVSGQAGGAAPAHAQVELVRDLSDLLVLPVLALTYVLGCRTCPDLGLVARAPGSQFAEEGGRRYAEPVRELVSGE